VIARAPRLLLAIALASMAVPAAAQPEVDARSIEPLPQAPRTLASWQQAFEQLGRGSQRQRIAAAEVGAARGRARVALADLLPHAQAQASYTHELIVVEENLGAGPVTVPAQDVLGAGVSANMALLDMRALHAYGTARRAVQAAERDLMAERRALVGELAEALLAAWTAERLAELHRIGLRAAADRLALAETKRTLGRATVLDVDRARQDLESARNETLLGDDALMRARASLGLVLGVSTAVAAPVTSDANGIERGLGAWCTTSVDAERAPEVAAAQLHVELADRALDGLDLELLPRLDFESQLRWDSETVYGPDATVQVGLFLRAPIWDGGARYGRRREAHARRTQAQLRLEQARTDARWRASETTREIAIATEASRIGATQRELALRIDRGTRLAFEQGVGTSLDLISAAQALRQAELNAVLLDARVVQARARAALTSAVCHF
jgi:outer membrane protein TolC